MMDNRLSMHARMASSGVYGSMAENEGGKGLFGRLFGRSQQQPEPQPPIQPEIPPATPPEAPPQAPPGPDAPTPEAPPFEPPGPEIPSASPMEEPPAPLPPELGANKPLRAGAESAPASWWTRLRSGLSRSSSSIGQGVASIFTKRKLGADTLEELEDVLIRSDLGVALAARIAESVGRGRYDKTIDPQEVREILAAEVEATLTPVARPLVIDGTKQPFVILVVGVNGSGKTTTIGKIAAKLVREGKKVSLAAGDTFRAAAIEQLKIWGARIGAPVIARDQGSDAASLAFEALTEARESGADVLLMDTAGRLQNRTELMAELEKIVRVMRKVDAQAPHAVLLVLDATVGQNALSQVEIFGRIAGVTGLVMTKLDGTARGGILVAIAQKHQLPVHFIGVGEGVEDLEPFEARDFARAIAGLDA